MRAFLVVVAVTSCSLALPLDDLHSGAVIPDRGADAGPMPPGDGARDSGRADTSDSGAKPDASSVGCAAFVPAPTFCDDFSSPLTGRWTIADGQGGSASLVEAPTLSPATALRCRVPGASSSETAAVRRRFPSARRIAVDFDVLPEMVPGTSGPAAIFEIVLGTNPGAGYVIVYVERSRLFVQLFENRPPNTYQDFDLLPGGLPPDRFTHVSLGLDLQVEGAGSKVSASAAGAAPVVDVPIAASFPPQPFEVGLGISQKNGSSEPWSFVFEDVRIDVE